VANISAKRKIGFYKWWNFWAFGERIRKRQNLPEALRQISLVSTVLPQLELEIAKHKESEKKGVLSAVPEWASAEIESSRFVSKDAAKRWGIQNNLVCLFPGSVWATKKWTKNGYVELGQALAQQGHQIFVMGGPGEEELALEISALIPQSRALAGKTSYMETLEILSQSRVVVSNDSAGQHLAALVGAPTVSIFGPTVLEFGYRPWNSKTLIVERKGLSCRPCGRHGHQKCPIGTHECMEKISPGEVLEAVHRALQFTRSQSL
jgi:heptosyltransferase-2